MAEEKKKGLVAEFRQFISRGNVVDMAVGVIMATAFGKITTSLVNDVVMPAIGYLFGGMDLTQLNIVLRPEVRDEAGSVVIAGVTIGIGTLISTLINFLLVALVVFLVIKGINTAKEKAASLRKKQEKEVSPEKAPAPSNEEKLLMEIRDLLQTQQK